ncbi:hypothetical protein L208DRAFT_1387555, partial [Tricholoma matsutake]
ASCYVHVPDVLNIKLLELNFVGAGIREHGSLRTMAFPSTEHVTSNSRES